MTTARKVLIIDCMGRELGAAMSKRVAETYEGRLPTVRIQARAQPEWAGVLDQLRAGLYAGVIFTGSKAGVYEPEPWIEELLAFTRDLVALEPRAPTPVLGICFGHQLIAEATAGPDAVAAQPPVRRGIAEIEVTGDAPIFDGMPRRFRAIITHQDHVLRIAPQFEVVARADYTPIHAVRHREKPIFGVQFHPEHCRATMAADEREYAHHHWESMHDTALSAAEGPRVLDNFARIVVRAAGGA